MKQGWAVKTLAEVCEIKTGKKDVNQGNPNGEFPFFTCAREHTYSNEFSFDTEALLIAGNGDVGTVSYYKGKFEAYQRTYVLFNFKNISPLFLFFILDGYLKQTVSKQKLGNTMPYIKMGMLADFKIPLPPLPEQKRIVAILDEAFDSITKAKENAEKNLQNARELFESYLQSVFANSPSAKATEDRPGDGWEVKKMGEVCDVRDGTHDSPKYVPEGIPFVTQKNITENGLDIANTKRISLTDHESFYKRSNVSQGDIIISMIGANRGMACLVNESTTFSIKNVGLVKANPKVNQDYLLYFLKSPKAKEYVSTYSKGGAQEFIGLTELRKFPVLFAPLSEQNRIVAKLDALSAETKKLEAIYRQKLTDLDELKKSVLQKAFTGQLTMSN